MTDETSTQQAESLLKIAANESAGPPVAQGEHQVAALGAHLARRARQVHVP